MMRSHPLRETHVKSRRAADSLGDGFEPAPLPAAGPDGLLDMSSLAKGEPPEPPPRICGYGPCRHYHTFQIVMDAATPMDGSDPGPPHIETQHYCYPTAGVETDLGNTPVTSCNRYAPPLLKIGARRRYERDVHAWAWRRENARADAAQLEADAAADLAEAEAARAAASSTPTSEGNA